MVSQRAVARTENPAAVRASRKVARTNRLSAHPTVEPQKIRYLVKLLTAISEGIVVLYGMSPARRASQARLVELAVRLIGLILPEITSASPLSSMPQARAPTMRRSV